jgi:hypothetical protein
LLLAASLCLGSPAIAVELPFLHESMARTAFVSGAYKSCFEKNRSIGHLSEAQLVSFCLCHGRALAESITSSEVEQLQLKRVPSIFEQKAQLASTLCTERLLPENRSTPRERDVARAMNQCMAEYHPEDTDYGAVVVRERFCICFGSGMVNLGAYGSSQPSAQAIKQLVGECSRKLSP